MVLPPRVLFPISITILGIACSPAGSGTLGGSGGSSETTSVSNGGTSDPGTSNGGSGGTTSSVVYDLPDAGPLDDSTVKQPAVWPPPDFVNVTDVSFGAYALGPEVSSQSVPTEGEEGVSACSGLFGVIRDFRLGTGDAGHPDFELPPMVSDTGIVTNMLGDDRKPVYDVDTHPDGTRTTSGQANFDQWYRDTPDVNKAYVIGLHFVQNGDVVTFAASNSNRDSPMRNSSYYPLDDQGFGNEDQNHNYGFTTEIHTKFTYNGGEIFTFQGDDDVFVYINRHLVIDLGGIHAQKTQSVNLDEQAEELEITVGNVYELDVFNAERHTTQSNFRIDTTMVFEDCGSIIP